MIRNPDHPSFFKNFFFLGDLKPDHPPARAMPIFLVRHMCGVFLYLSRILTGSRAREARATTACVGRKLGMGLPGPHISRDAPPTCGTESSEWV